MHSLVSWKGLNLPLEKFESDQTWADGKIPHKTKTRTENKDF
jgi:hypothetical protein